MKNKIRFKKLKVAVLVAMILGTASAHYQVFYAEKNITRYEAPQVFAQETNDVEIKIEKAKWDVVDRLEGCENKKAISDENKLVIIDNNSRGTLTGIAVFSFGSLQWKVPTVKQFVKARDDKDISAQDAIALALDREKARNLTYFAIWNTDGGIFHWENCARDLKLVDEIALIKKITQ